MKLSVGADGSASDGIPVSNGLDTTAAGVLAVGIVGQFDDAATGAVTENQFAPVRITSARRLMTSAVLEAGTAAFGKLAANSGVDIGDVDVTSSALPTGASTSAKQDTIIGHVDGIEALLTTIDADTSNLSVVGGGTEAAAQRVTIASDSTGVLSVDDNGGNLSIDDGGNSITVDGTVAVTNAGLTALNGAIAGTEVQVDVLTMPSTAVTNAGTFAVQLATNTPVGNIAHDSADSGGPLKIGGRADTTFQTAVADGDRVDALFDVYGAIRARTDQPNLWSYHDDDAAAVTTDGTVQSAPGAGLSVYITDVIFSIGAATASSIFLEESTTKIIGPIYLEAIAGRTVHVRFATPKKCTANTAILVTNTGSITFSVDILGFIAP